MPVERIQIVLLPGMDGTGDLFKGKGCSLL